MGENCIFCRIVAGNLSSRTIYEDESFRVVLDANPASKGHVLIMTKEHYENLYEIPEELAGKAMALAKKIGTHLKEKLNCDGLNLLQNNGQVAGQTVFHFHLHLIPRYEDMENNDLLRWNTLQLSEEERIELEKNLKMQDKKPGQ